MVFYHPVKINWYHPVSCPYLSCSICLSHSFLLWLFCFILSLLTGYHLIKYEMITDKSPLNQNVLKAERPLAEQSFDLQWLDSLRWGDGVQVQSDLFPQSCLIYSAVSWALGTRIQRTIVQPWQAVGCLNNSLWHTWEPAHTIFDWLSKEEKSENRPKEWSQSYKCKHELVYSMKRNQESTRLHEIGD